MLHVCYFCLRWHQSDKTVKYKTKVTTIVASICPFCVKERKEKKK